MKYIVMECHEAYAVLMDEESSFVHAANMHYKVGQTVTDPVIMGSERVQSGRKNIVMTRIAAAAACAVLVGAGGVHYYAQNYKPHSTIMISSDAEISMTVNKRGKVISLKSNNKKGKEILIDYNGKGKDKATVANELLELEMSKGMISNGDTVELYISTQDSSDYNKYRDELEKSLSELDIKVNVQDKEAVPKPAKEKDAAPEPPKPAVPDPKAVDTVRPDPEANIKKPDPVDPESAIQTPPKPDESPAEDKPVPPPSPSTPESDINREEKHDAIEKNKKTAQDAEVPAPPAPDKNGEADPPHPDPKQEPADKAGSEEKPPVPPEGNSDNVGKPVPPPAPAPARHEAPPPTPITAPEV